LKNALLWSKILNNSLNLRYIRVGALVQEGKARINMDCRITLIPGDGIGPEIVTEAVKVLDAVAAKYGHKFDYTKILMGGCSIDECGVPLTDEAVAVAKASDAVLLGAVGGNVGNSRWYDVAPNLRPEAGLLKIRKDLELFANIRPAYLYNELKAACPLKEEIIGDGFDMVIMRELTGGLYFGKRHTEEVDGLMTAVDTLTYNEEEIRRIAIKGFEIAMKRRKKVTSVDKANVLDSSRLWRKIVHEVAKDYPEVELEDMLVDNCAMQLVMNPGQFDVILTENMFGDILSDEASMITGSIGMLSSASLGKTKLGLYEPSHGSAPDIAGKNIANPIATILSAAMMLRYSLDLDKEADAIEAAVAAVLKEGYRTTDIYSEGCTKVGTDEMGDLIAKRV
jgi:3-isopropylmalate dehydrogenase